MSRAKARIEAADLAHRMRRADRVGLDPVNPDVDLAAVMRHAPIRELTNLTLRANTLADPFQAPLRDRRGLRIGLMVPLLTPLPIGQGPSVAVPG